jgi:cyclase
MDRALRAGADKVSVNTAAVHRPALLGEAAARFGMQCVVLSIDAARTDGGDRFDVFTHGGRTASGLDAVEWARTGVAAGAGEILITSIDRDGRRDGYDIPLTRSIVEAVAVPVIASGGAGEAAHLREAFIEGGADAALAAGMFHDGTTTVTAVKAFLSSAGVPVRTPTGGTV